ncbi:alpha/beta hydrolase [Tengunoibacter tsumagoiensis]|uniref:Lipase/esterase n=1 Tax=Tengunoibacter tsumagoiensis TaxID=2014871 RepID=A0A402AA16_9CHLR|nr:alpha/beta hydrolase [Tengunoibacter tsumagoiensis]GCE15969.1 lipase/esterase [Tengunoibacter tsumagoiensis]
MPLDPLVARYLEKLNALHNDEPAQDLSLAEKRLRSEQNAIAQAGERVSIGSIMNLTIPGPASDLPLRVYIPEEEGPFPIFVHFHSGGWVFGSIEASDAVCRLLAKQAHCIVISVGYRLAPEHRFPAAPEDCYSATVWAHAHAHEINGDPDRIAIGGDSAGGNLTAAVTLMARDREGPKLCCQVIIYGETNYPEPETASYTFYAHGYDLTREDMIWYWDQYLACKEDANHPYASPLRAEDLSHLPPALIITAEYDPVRDEAELYAQRLQQAGIPVQLTRYNGMLHSFFRMFTIFPQSNVALQEVANYLAGAFQKGFV